MLIWANTLTYIKHHTLLVLYYLYDNCIDVHNVNVHSQLNTSFAVNWTH